MPGRKLHELKPREQAGSETELRYDYQYLQAARACLELLEATQDECVFCEWHDDFVVAQIGPSCTLYAFHQVKSKKLALGPWKIAEVFGVDLRKKKPVAPHQDAMVVHMLDHYLRFPDECTRVVLITNAALQPDLDSLLVAVREAASPAELPAKQKNTFNKLTSAYCEANDALTPIAFLNFLKKMDLVPEVGTISAQQFADNYTVLGGKIVELSEIHLKVPQAVHIARELVELVRKKSKPVAFPVSEEQLRTAKGVVPDEVLSVLSLSPEGYRELRAHGAQGIDTVRALSRLQRLCDASGLPPSVIADICKMKAGWDRWERTYIHIASATDRVGLRTRCEEMLAAHAAGALPFPKLSGAAQDTAAEFEPRIKSLEPLSRELVLGYVFAIASLRGV